MRKTFLAAALSLACGTSFADVSNCSNMYVGSILVENGYSLFKVVFLNNPGDASGSQSVYFNRWPADDKKAALALLTTAKISQHRVHLVIEEGGCDIGTNQRTAKSITLAMAP